MALPQNLWPCLELNIRLSGSTLWPCRELNLRFRGSILWPCIICNVCLKYQLPWCPAYWPRCPLILFKSQGQLALPSNGPNLRPARGPLTWRFSSRHSHKVEPLTLIFSSRHCHNVEPLNWRSSSRHSH